MSPNARPQTNNGAIGEATSSPQALPSTTTTSSTSGASSTSQTATTFSSTTTSPTSPVSTNPRPKIVYKSDPGTIAGVAVGAAIGAALIAFLLTWMIMRKHTERHRHRRSSEKSHGSEYGNGRASTKEPAVLVKEHTDARHAWEKHLPQSADDNTVRLSVKTLFDQIELHVENYYRDTAVPLTQEMQTELLKLDSPHLPDSVIGLLPQARAPTVLIKHCLAQMVVSSISTDGHTTHSFLPADFVALPQTLDSSRNSANKPAFVQALSRWRVLSAYLRPTPRTDASYLSARDAIITQCADVFCGAFAPWAIGSRRDTYGPRHQNLIEVMKAASDTGILLFAQPSTFTYRWTAPSTGGTGRGAGAGGRIVVTPALVKVADENAVVLERGLELVTVVTQSAI